MHVKLPKALLQYTQPFDAADERRLLIAWCYFRHAVWSRDREELSPDQAEVARIVLGEIFRVPEAHWKRFTRCPSRKQEEDPSKWLAKVWEEELVCQAQAQKVSRRSPKPKLVKIMVRRATEKPQKGKPVSKAIWVQSPPRS